MAALVLIMKFFVHFASLDLGSMPELHVVLVPMVLYIDFWVCQVRITDLINKQIPVYSRNQR